MRSPRLSKTKSSSGSSEKAADSIASLIHSVVECGVFAAHLTTHDHLQTASFPNGSSNETLRNRQDDARMTPNDEAHPPRQKARSGEATCSRAWTSCLDPFRLNSRLVHRVKRRQAGGTRAMG
jgi:hypothetical protein